MAFLSLKIRGERDSRREPERQRKAKRYREREAEKRKKMGNWLLQVRKKGERRGREIGRNRYR